VPEVIEPSAGVDRTMLTLLVDAFDVEKIVDEESKKEEERFVMHLCPIVAPIQVGVFPLSKKLALHARNLERELRSDFRTFYDESGAIGRRYRRQDEIGTPFCLTFDFQSETDRAVTVRDRDTMSQDRVPIDQVTRVLREKIAGWARRPNLGRGLGD
jgi:glycyl-tRNA synthetase